MLPNHPWTHCDSISYVYPALELRPADGRSYRYIFDYGDISIRGEGKKRIQDTMQRYCTECIHTIHTYIAIHRDTQIDVLIRSVIHLFSHVHMDASDTVG